MHAPPDRQTARLLLRLHGLQAQAIALEHAAEMHQQGDAAGFDRWRRVQAAIGDLRRMGSQASPDPTPSHA